MRKKEQLLYLPNDMPTVVNPVEGYFRQFCNPEGFVFPKRVIATEGAFEVLDRYEELVDIPSWWRYDYLPRPLIGVNALYFPKVNTFFESIYPVSERQLLQRSAHETAHAVICAVEPREPGYNISFIEALAEWIAGEVLSRSNPDRMSLNWHIEMLQWKETKSEQAKEHNIYNGYLRRAHQQYIHGHKALFRILPQLFEQSTPILDQVQFLLSNYDEQILGSEIMQDVYIKNTRFAYANA